MPKTKTMSSRFGGFLPRIAFFVVVIVLATATLTLAAQKRATYTAPAAAPAAPPAVIKVPDVTGQAYVFAKGVLEDSGFAWRVGSGAPGYAGYRVTSQFPAAGTDVVDTGAPTVVLHIEAVKHYDVTSTTGPRTKPTEPTEVKIPDGQPCKPSLGAPGFTVTDTRTLRDVKTGQVKTDRRTTRYNPSPIVTCGGS